MILEVYRTQLSGWHFNKLVVGRTVTKLTAPWCFVCVGAEALDECGLRYLLAMRLHTCLLTSLPPLYRMQLLHQGKTHCSKNTLSAVLYRMTATPIYCHLMLMRCWTFLSCKLISLHLRDRLINMPLCMGLPLGGGRGAAEHDPSHAERRPTVVWAQSCWSGLVDTQHQHSAENGGKGTGTI